VAGILTGYAEGFKPTPASVTMFLTIQLFDGRRKVCDGGPDERLQDQRLHGLNNHTGVGPN
jgi:hypothetical protein